MRKSDSEFNNAYARKVSVVLIQTVWNINWGDEVWNISQKQISIQREMYGESNFDIIKQYI